MILSTLLYSLFQSKDKWFLYKSQNFFKLFVNVVSSRHICKSRRNTNHTPSSPWVKLVIHTWNFQTFEHVSFCCDVLIIQVFNDMKIWISIPKAASNVLGGCPISTVVMLKILPYSYLDGCFTNWSYESVLLILICWSLFCHPDNFFDKY